MKIYREVLPEKRYNCILNTGISLGAGNIYLTEIATLLFNPLSTTRELSLARASPNYVRSDKHNKKAI